MQEKIKMAKLVESKSFYLRTLTRSGGTRYLAIGTIVPPDWDKLKVVVEAISNDGCLLRLIPIK